MVGGIYEVVRLVGGLKNSHFTTATTSTSSRSVTAALATSEGEVVLFSHRDGESSTFKIPWVAEEGRQPVALAFSPNAEWLLVASEDGTLFVVPIGGRLDPTATRDQRFRTDDVQVLPPNGSRARPTSLVWWQTEVGDVSLGIIGTELGELSFVELGSGREVGGTYITVPVTHLHLCRDNAQDTIYLLITGTEERQWRLVLEQRSSQYLFPLELITPDWPNLDTGIVGGGAGSLVRAGPPPTRSRLLGLKQLSVEKLQMLRQRLAEAKTGSRRKPLTENKGVDTCDIDEVSSPAPPTPPDQPMPTPQQHGGPVSIESSGGVGESVPPPTPLLPPHTAARPERLCRYIHDAPATPQYARERHLLAAHCRDNDTLMVYSTDLEPTPLYVFKVVPGAEHVALQDEIIFLTHATPRLSLVSTFFASSSKIDGTIDSKINPVVQEIDLPPDEPVLSLHPSPSLIPPEEDSPPCSARSSQTGGVRSRRGHRRREEEEEEEEEVEVPTHTWPQGCLVVTTKALYVCQPRMSVESLFMALVLRAGDIEAANKLGVIFALDPKLFELAADVKLRARNFSAAIALYKHSRCPHVKCSIKFAAQGLVTEFLTYMGTLTSGVSGPDLGAEERRNLANLAILAHLHQLCHPPAHPRPSPAQLSKPSPHPHQQALRNLLLFLRDNQHYDEILALAFSAGSWRWETLQYLAASRGLYLEKLHALLSPQASPILDILTPEQLNGVGGEGGMMPITREREAGYLHCVSDPELRQVLLVRPSLARTHIALVLSLLPTLEIDTLRRLAELYNPTHPAIRPFLQTTNGRRQPYPSALSSATASCHLLPYGSEEMLSVEAFVEVFLAIMVQLNHKRGWIYNPELLTYTPDTDKENSQPPPVPLESLQSRVLSCGYGHSAMVVSGALYTWGLGDCGVLGLGPRSLTPHKLSAGLNMTLPLDVEQPGLNNSMVGVGQLGSLHPTPTNGRGPSPSSSNNNNNTEGAEPSAVTYLGQCRVLCVSCGKNHSLAITDNGVYGWGSSRYGQVGAGGTGRHPRPVLLASLEGRGITLVACGQFHSLGVSLDGTLYTWGWGVHGQLGNDSVEDCHLPTPVQPLAKKKIVSADGGYAHSVAMTSDGEVYAWGCGTYGQVGNGGIVKVTRPEQVPLPGPATHLTSGYFQNLAVTKNHKVYMWGNNPACLRVQAQLQRRTRNCQQQQQQQPLPDSSRRDEENGNLENGKTWEGSGESVGVRQGVVEGDNAEKVNSEDSGMCSETNSGVSESEDTIAVLPEDENERVEGTPSFVISPSPSPEKVVEAATAETEGECPKAEKDGEDLKFPGKGTEEDSGGSCEAKAAEEAATPHLPRTVSANTVPSCDPSDLGHLLPREVEMPHGFGAVRAVGCGSQHCVLLTTHGALYAWGRNMAGQLGTGNRREVCCPTRIMDDTYVTEVACGADFTLALESQGQLWGWGSNFYSQLGRSIAGEEDKGQAGRVFMLRTTKRVLKVPHTVHSNCETPRPVLGLPVPHPTPQQPHYGLAPPGTQQEKAKGGAHWWLGQIRLDSITESECVGEKETKPGGSGRGGASPEEGDDSKFGPCTLRTALSFLHGSYSTKNVTSMLQEAEGHQALATLYTLERQYSQAMHHHLYALLKQSGDMYTKDVREEDSTKEKEMESGKKSNPEEGNSQFPAKSSLVSEAVRIIDHYLRLQTEESQTGMRHVLQEGISLWLSHALPLPQLEDLLLTHLPRTVYPLALLLFGDGAPSEKEGPEESDTTSDPAMKVLGQLSTKFCLNLCTSVITHLQAGGGGGEYTEAVSQLGSSSGPDGSQDPRSSFYADDATKLDAALDALAKKGPGSITLTQQDVHSLQEAQKGEGGQPGKRSEGSRGSISAGTSKQKGTGKTTKEGEKDCVLFTCGHHFTQKEFKTRVLPQMETSVMTVPGLLGNTARVLLDQYHSDQPEMACPHCVLAHLTIKLTKHKQTK